MTQFNFGEPNHGSQDWALIRGGDIVDIPLLPYRTTGMEPQNVVMAAMEILLQYLDHCKDAKRTHIVLGDPFEDLRPEWTGWRFWLGFAFRVH